MQEDLSKSYFCLQCSHSESIFLIRYNPFNPVQEEAPLAMWFSLLWLRPSLAVSSIASNALPLGDLEGSFGALRGMDKGVM